MTHIENSTLALAIAGSRASSQQPHPAAPRHQVGELGAGGEEVWDGGGDHGQVDQVGGYGEPGACEAFAVGAGAAGPCVLFAPAGVAFRR